MHSVGVMWEREAW